MFVKFHKKVSLSILANARRNREHPKEQDEDVDKEEDQDVRRRIRISRMMIRMKMTMTCRMMTMMIFEDTRHVQFGTRCIEIQKDPSLTMILDSDFYPASLTVDPKF